MKDTAFFLFLKGLGRATTILRSFFFRFAFSKVGSGLTVLAGVRISGGANIKVGRNCFIGRNVVIDASQGMLEIGDNVEVRDAARIYAQQIRIGDKVTIAEGSFLNGKIDIEAGSWIARNCDLDGEILIEQAILGPRVACIGGADHMRHSSGKFLMSSEKNSTKSPRILIQKGSWIGHSAIILKGVTIANNSLVAAGAVVTKDFPTGSVLAGVPARLISAIH